MTIALYVVTGLLIVLLLYSAALKIAGRQEVVASYARVGVPPEKLRLLAVILLLGALGLTAGFYWTFLGVLAAAAFVLYFLLALGAHAAHRDLRNAATPTVMLLLAAATAILFAWDA